MKYWLLAKSFERYIRLIGELQRKWVILQLYYTRSLAYVFTILNAKGPGHGRLQLGNRHHKKHGIEGSESMCPLAITQTTRIVLFIIKNISTVAYINSKQTKVIKTLLMFCFFSSFCNHWCVPWHGIRHRLVFCGEKGALQGHGECMKNCRQLSY